MNRWISPEEAAGAIEHGRGNGIRIAVLDSGIEIAHPELRKHRLRHDFEIELNHRDPFLHGTGRDLYGHGTAIAGIIWKLAPEAEIGSFRILGPNLQARTAQVSLAAHRAIDLGYDILNCSFSCSVTGHLSLYKEWVDRAERCGVHVVAASGSHEPDQPEWPAHFTSVLGTDAGLPADRRFVCRPGRTVEFAAPGWNLRVPWKNGSHRVMTGSSFAAAHLSGILSRLLSVYPLKDPLLVKALLRKIGSARQGIDP